MHLSSKKSCQGKLVETFDCLASSLQVRREDKSTTRVEK
jgi:hypothetical protein